MQFWQLAKIPLSDLFGFHTFFLAVEFKTCFTVIISDSGQVLNACEFVFQLVVSLTLFYQHFPQVDPIIQKGHEGLVHHIVLYECSHDFPRAFLNHSGHCFENSAPRAVMKCAGESIMAAWAIGGGVTNCLTSLATCFSVLEFFFFF